MLNAVKSELDRYGSRPRGSSYNLGKVISPTLKM